MMLPSTFSVPLPSTCTRFRKTERPRTASLGWPFSRNHFIFCSSLNSINILQSSQKQEKQASHVRKLLDVNLALPSYHPKATRLTSCPWGRSSFASNYLCNSTLTQNVLPKLPVQFAFILIGLWPELTVSMEDERCLLQLFHGFL